VPEPQRPEPAKLIELDSELKEKSGGKVVPVQINPESLKVSYANQVKEPKSAGDRRGTQARQFVGAGTTKMSVQLWFDVGAPLPAGKQSVTDVRQLTGDVAFFMTAKQVTGKPGDNDALFVPPGVRFDWGTFRFEGLMDSLEESLEFWSADGQPLRASVSIGMSQQKIVHGFARDPRAGGPGAANVAPPGAAGAPGAPATGAAAGTSPLAQARAGATLQGMAGATGDWQAIAVANGIENPRLLAPGQLVNLDTAVRIR
jgi:hypothetical protein